MTGYEALRQTAAWIDLSNRGKIRMTGEDRARLLHAMTTNHIQQLRPGAGCYVFFLNAQGRILADASVYTFADHFLLDTEPETTEKVQQHLDHYIIADDVTLENVTYQWAAVGLEGPQSAEKLASLGAPIPAVDYHVALWGNGFVSKNSATGHTGQPGYRIFVPFAERDALFLQLTNAGIEQADAEAARTVRLENGKPRYGEDITERYLVQETGQLHAVHFTKGCYLGQEIVERVRSRAQIHRTLSPVRIKSEAAPTPGTKLKHDGNPAGEITSAIYSPGLGEVAGLAYVRVEIEKTKPILQLAEMEPPVTAYIPEA